MAFVLTDRVKETTTIEGTGTATLLGAVTSYISFGSALSDNDTTYYCIADASRGGWEVGLGTYSSNTLARTTVLQSSNADALVNFSPGTKDVFMTYPADKAVFEDADGNVYLPGDLELGHATDTTLSRVSAGVVAVEGTNIAMSGGAFHDGFSDFVSDEHLASSTFATAAQGTTADAAAVSGGAEHDGFSDFVANEHLDWTTDRGATNLHANNSANGSLALASGEVTQLANIGATTISASDWTALSNLSGTNTGDQTSIVGITGTKSQFDTAVTDGNIAYSGGAHHDGFSDFVANEHLNWTADLGATNLHVNNSANAVLALTSGEVTQLANIGATAISLADWQALAVLVGTNTGDQTSIVGISGTKAEFDTAVSDGNIQYVGDAPTSHTIVSHDTTATGAELTALADNSSADGKHWHSKLAAVDGSPYPALSMDAAGNLVLAVGNVELASGAGIDFSLTSDAAGSTSELFDDFEEGDWDPVLEGSTGSGTYVFEADRTSGRYQKTGEIVEVWGVYRVSSVTSAGTGDAIITGLPYVAGNPTGASLFARAFALLDCSPAPASGTTQFKCSVDGGLSYLTIWDTSSGGSVREPVTDMDEVNLIVTFHATYRVA